MDEELSLLRATLKRVDFFYALNLAQLDALIGALRKSHAHRGEILIHQGDIGDRFYIIAEGGVSVQVKKTFWGRRKIAVLSSGDFFGEMALVSDQPRNATVVAEEDTQLYELHKKDFREILLQNPKISQLIQEAIQRRTPA